jgi:DNA-nicking Smr family endonuclease
VVKKQKQQFLDEHLFRQEMDDVVPLKTRPTTESKLPKTPYHRRNLPTEPEIFDSPYRPLEEDKMHVDSDDGSSHRKNGVQKRILQRLKRGQFTVGEQLDLHHMTTRTGQAALLEFIAHAQDRSLESVRIIHGKGTRSESGPRLKIMTHKILREHPQVLAFTACKPADGGTGATDILLKST